MKRSFKRIPARGAALAKTAAILLLLFLCVPGVQAGNFCNNAARPCNPDEPPKPGDATASCYRPPAPPATCERCGECTKSPCYVASGVYATEAHDLEIRTVGLPIEMSRLYQTSHVIDGELGRGWVSSLSARLYYTVSKLSLPGSPLRDSMEAHVRLPSGSLYRFTERQDGTFTPPLGRFDRLVRNADDTWDLWLQNSRSHFHFAATGQLLRSVDDFGNTVSWTYVQDRLRRVSDVSGSGRFIEVTWGADGRISDVVDQTGRTVHYEYSGSVLTGVTNPLNQTTHYGYVSGKYAPLLSTITDHWSRNVSTITYDGVDRVVSYTDRGEIYNYTYRYNDTSSTTAKTDSSGNRWLYTYNADGLVTATVPPGGGSTGQVAYNANGLVDVHTDALGVRTRFTYDNRGNIATKTFDEGGPDSVELRYVYHPDFPDDPVSVTAYTPGTNNIHRHWQGRKYDYYPLGSIAPGALHHEYEVDDDGVTSGIVRTYTYDAQGRTLTETSAGGGLRSFTYDPQGNLIREEAPPNNDTGARPARTYTYDTLGRGLTHTDPNGNVTTLTWDALDRVTSHTEPIPSSGWTSPAFRTTTVYDEYDPGSQLLEDRTVDPNGAVSVVARDAYGQVVRQTNAAGDSHHFVWEKGLLKSRIDPNDYVTTHQYDGRRRLTHVSYSDLTFEQYTYLADESIGTFRNRAGITATYGYDRLKRMTSTTYPGGRFQRWTYTGQKLTLVEDARTTPAETLSRTWNASFRIASETQSGRGTVAWTYDDDGEKATETIAGGATTTYSHYPNGSLREIQWSLVSGAFRHEYDLAGQLTRIQFPNGQQRSWTYDGQGRTASVANTHPTAGNLATFTYGYDNHAFTGQATRLGMLTTATTSLPALAMAGAVTRYDYDARQMLIRAEYPAGAPYNGTTSAWSFDRAGNRISAATNGNAATYTYRKDGTNAFNSSVLLSDGGNSYSYDAAGNTTARTGSRGNYTFQWDVADRLTSVGGQETESYRYDSINRRVSTTTAAGTTNVLYSMFQPVAESGASNAQYLFTSGFDHPLAMFRGGQTYYYSVDGQGSVVAVNQDSGAVVNSYAYDAWGVAVAQNETVANPFGYTARPLGAAGLADHRFRAYESATGSFRSVDPLITAMGMWRVGPGTRFPALHAYGYTDGRPTMFTDPFGLEKCRDCIKELDERYDKCWKTWVRAMKYCHLKTAGCLLMTANPPWCLAEWVHCETKAGEEKNGCYDDAIKDFDDCVEDCRKKVCRPKLPVGGVEV